MSAPAIVFVVGTVETKFGLVGLPYSLFTVLVVLIFIELLGYRFGDLTSCTVDMLEACSCSRASINSSDSLSPSMLD